MKYFLISIFFLFQLSLIGQTMSRAELSKLEDADIDFEIGDYKRASDVYIQLLEKYPESGELNLKTGISLYHLRNPSGAIEYLEKAKNSEELEAYFYLGQAYHFEGKLDEEIELYQIYKNNTRQKKQPIETVNRALNQAILAKEMIDRPVHVEILNIGKPVNSEYHEYVPLTYGLEDNLYFTSRRPESTGGLTDHRGDFYEDVYVSKSEHGRWQAPAKLNEQINTNTHDACVGISSDGQILYIFRTSEDMLSSNLYQSEMSMDGWSTPVMLGSDINSDFVESSASISSDDRILYFSSNRKGGFGGLDIYRAVKLPTGDWSKALNLGPTINTPENEDSPFIHTDNKTIYFSSEGHKGMGGYDIFRSELREDGMWTEPRNMGYPINTLSHDLNFVMSADKQTGYYASSKKGGLGGQDIYNIKFKLEAQILSVVKGGVKSGNKTNIPLEATITLINSETKSIQGVYRSNPTTGKFIMVVTPDSKFQVIVEAEGFHVYSGELYFDSNVGFGSNIEEFKLVPMEVVSNE